MSLTRPVATWERFMLAEAGLDGIYRLAEGENLFDFP
jgi:hypothetical protein